MLVPNRCLHNVENLIDRAKVQLANTLIVLWEIGFIISADVKLAHLVYRPNVLVGWMKFYKVWILVYFHSNTLVFQWLLLLLLRVANFITVDVLHWVHQQDIIWGGENLMVYFLKMKVSRRFSKEWKEAINVSVGDVGMLWESYEDWVVSSCIYLREYLLVCRIHVLLHNKLLRGRDTWRWLTVKTELVLSVWPPYIYVSVVGEDQRMMISTGSFDRKVFR